MTEQNKSTDPQVDLDQETIKQTEVENQEQSVEVEEHDVLEEAIARVQELEEQLEAQVKEAAQKEQDMLLRSRAEMDNIRRRATLDVEKAHKFALEKFAKELLETIDNLERALATPTDTENEAIKSVMDGVELTLKVLKSTVERFGVKAVGEVGDTFNPELHHAIKQEPTEGFEPNKITNVLQKGYLLNDRVIRPAMVMISA